MVGVVVVVVELESGLIMHTYINPSLLAIINAANQSYLFTRSIRRSSSVSWSPSLQLFQWKLTWLKTRSTAALVIGMSTTRRTTLDK